ncbi:MAG: 50S ribosomal protein L30 [Candidatus Heimdallarchaeaceae archaeon]
MSKIVENNALLAVIRIRGRVGFYFKIKETLDMLNIRRVNYMTLIPSTSSYLGMLKRAKDAITYGEINVETLAHLLRKRGELEGRKRLTDKYVQENSEYADIEDFAKAIIEGKAKLTDLPGLKKFFRLHPPRKGFKSVKRGYKEKGDLGYRGEAINELIVRMA